MLELEWGRAQKGNFLSRVSFWARSHCVELFLIYFGILLELILI